MLEPLVFLPDIATDVRLFLPQITAMTHERPVMAAPVGQGDRVDDIASALMQSLPAKFALCGQGLGGMVAMEVMRRAPERVLRIALINTSPLQETPQDAAEREVHVMAARAGRLEDAVTGEIPISSLAPGPHRQDVMNKLMAMARTAGADLFVRQSRAMQRRRDQQSTLRRVRQPAVVICGEHDTVFPMRRQETMASLIPDAKFVVLPDAGHMPSLEAPSALTKHLRDWLAMPQAW